jgi:prolyl oligopeptidase
LRAIGAGGGVADLGVAADFVKRMTDRHDAVPAAATEIPQAADDPYLWLEEIDTAAVRAWIEARNRETMAALGDAQFEADRKAVLDILDAADRIPGIRARGALLYNFWQDAEHRKGLWRRTTLSSYRGDNPAWETLLDVDLLAEAEGEDWVWRGCTTLPPEHRHGLVQLSRGGADAVVIREFDLTEKRFVEGGFYLPEAKGGAAWLDADTLLVSSALGGAAFETASGYPRTVRLLRRGAPLEAAPIVFECERDHMVAWGVRDHGPRYPRTLYERRTDFQHHEDFFEQGGAEPIRLDIPTDTYFTVDRDWLVLNLRSDWQVGGRTFPAGALLVTSLIAFFAGARDLTVLFEPAARRFLDGFSTAGDVIAFKVLDNVRSHIFLARCAQGQWHCQQLGGFSDLSTLDIFPLALDDDEWFAESERERGAFVVAAQNSVTPPSQSLVRFGGPAEPLKHSPERFSAAALAITQHEAAAADGTRIPYFQIGRVDAPPDGSNAVLLTGYGGYQISSLPYYRAATGKLWLERGGTVVIANIRGGGEFGPDWHKVGMRAGKKLAHDDFAAVAKDLIARGITRPARLACVGASNGGLLVGNMFTRYPELFGAVECAVPLLDMRRYTKLTAGSSWISEYGDPDNPADWDFLRVMSAYQAVAPGRPYPPILLTTSARDDRVHPGHARKMAAKLLALGYRVYFYEPREGGHAGATDNAQLAFNTALGFAFLRKTIAPEMAPR